MADPVTIFTIVSGSVGLALKCAQIAQSLYDLSGKYKQAELMLRTMVNECEIIELAWKRIEDWSRSYADDASADGELIQRLNRSLEVGALVMSALESDVSPLRDSLERGSLRRRSRIIWNESTFRDHQDRIRGQAGAMTLLLNVIKL